MTLRSYAGEARLVDRERRTEHPFLPHAVVAKVGFVVVSDREKTGKMPIDQWQHGRLQRAPPAGTLMEQFTVRPHEGWHALPPAPVQGAQHREVRVAIYLDDVRSKPLELGHDARVVDVEE